MNRRPIATPRSAASNSAAGVWACRPETTSALGGRSDGRADARKGVALMGTTLQRVASLLVVCCLSVTVAGPAAAVIRDPQRADQAMAYVGAQERTNGSFPGFSAIGSTADAVLDMAATGYGGEAGAIGFLRRQVRKDHVTTVGLMAKVVM